MVLWYVFFVCDLCVGLNLLAECQVCLQFSVSSIIAVKCELECLIKLGFFYSSVADRGTNPPQTMEMVDFVSLHHSSGDCVQAPCWIYIAEPLNRAWHFEGAKCLLQNSPLPSSACLPPPRFLLSGLALPIKSELWSLEILTDWIWRISLSCIIGFRQRQTAKWLFVLLRLRKKFDLTKMFNRHYRSLYLLFTVLW